MNNIARRYRPLFFSDTEPGKSTFNVNHLLAVVVMGTSHFRRGGDRTVQRNMIANNDASRRVGGCSQVFSLHLIPSKKRHFIKPPVSL